MGDRNYDRINWTFKAVLTLSRFWSRYVRVISVGIKHAKQGYINMRVIVISILFNVGRERHRGKDSNGVEIKCPFALKECVCVWTSGALGSNNCILDVSKQSTLRAYWVEPSCFLVKGRFEMCLGLRKPRVFLHHELIVYFITHFFFRLCLSLQRWNKQDTYQNHYSQVRKAVTSVCVTFVSLPCPTYWPICPGRWNMCHLPLLARLAAELMEHSPCNDIGNGWGLYIIAGRERGQWQWITILSTTDQEQMGANSHFETGNPFHFSKRLIFGWRCWSVHPNNL